MMVRRSVRRRQNLKIAMPDAALRGYAVGERLHFSNAAVQDRYFQAVLQVKVHVHRCHGKMMAIML